MSNSALLKSFAQYSSERISVQDITSESFVTVDNMLPNKAGVIKATIPVPVKGKMPAYQSEDILIGNIRPYLKKIWFANKCGGCSPDVLVLKTNPNHHSKFVYYALLQDSFFVHMMNGAKGTKMPRGDKRQVLEFLIPNYTLPEQKKIATILSFLDAKIDLNNRINAELEAMAKTLYDYWFVQFDFPEENGKPYKSSGGKMRFDRILKREIPIGWDVVGLRDIANIVMGQSPPGESYNHDANGLTFYQGSTDFGIRFPSPRQYTTFPTRFAKKNDILLSVRAPVGSFNIANEDCCIGRGLAALNSKDNSISYLLGVISNLKQVFDRRNNDGTTFGAITKNDLFSLNVIKPPSIILNNFNELAHPIFEKQNINTLENEKLSQLRDWLLPMLMNGQVKVN